WEGLSEGVLGECGCTIELHPHCRKWRRNRSVPMACRRQESGRSERIRTSGIYVPNVALYQAELHSDLHHPSTSPAEGWPVRIICQIGGLFQEANAFAISAR